jgi:hypothetical protein
MRAHEGDWLVIMGVTVGVPEQRGRIIEVRSEDGSPPYLVRWISDNHVSTVFPGPDAVVHTRAEMEAEDEQARSRYMANEGSDLLKPPVSGTE